MSAAEEEAAQEALLDPPRTRREILEERYGYAPSAQEED